MKTVLITGAARGIGKEIALELAKEGYNIVLNFNKSEEQAKEVADKISKLGARVLICQADVSKPEEVKKLVGGAVSVFGKIDVLVNNAGISLYKLLIDSSDAEIQNAIQTNLNSVIFMSREVVKNMLQFGGGKIINISSKWGIVGGSGESVYSAAKSGIIGFSKALAKEVGFSGINVNVVAPGVIETDMIKNLSMQDKKELESQIALGRIGQPSDVAGVVKFLASDEASYITGQVIEVDGGWGV
ncbi:MAG: glucose 1-dehydrogenase [Clostridia bacterium]|nr:glucose 1-dehydrogenase [Clostridia bacterium]